MDNTETKTTKVVRDPKPPVAKTDNPTKEHVPLSQSGGGCYVLKNGKRTKV